MSADILWDVSDDPTPADAAVVDGGLDAFNQQAADFGLNRRLACFARLPSGEVIGGAVGRYWGEACELQQIWVRQEYRRSGIGARLVRLFEEHARQRACSHVYLDTFTFQAPEFYRRLGYEVACEITGFPSGASKLIMRRTLKEA